MCQGGRKFYEKLKSELEKRGHVQSASDSRIFFKKGIIVLYCEYNCLLFAQNRKLSNEIFAYLKENFLCTDEGEAYGHLGVEINAEDGTITLKYLQLIKITIKLLRLNPSILKLL